MSTERVLGQDFGAGPTHGCNTCREELSPGSPEMLSKDKDSPDRSWGFIDALRVSGVTGTG